MKTIPKFETDISDGKMFFRDRKKFDEFVASQQNDKYFVTITRYKKPRSDKQNRYFHGVVVPLATKALFEAGLLPYEDLEMGKQVLKEMFLEEYRFELNGNVYIKVKETSLLKTDEAEEFFAKIRVYFDTEMQFHIPEPNEVEWEKFYQ